MLALLILFSCVLCNINARFAPIFYKKAIIPHFLIFCKIRNKIKLSDGRYQVKRKFLIYSIRFTVAKRFATTKEFFATTKLKLRNTSLGFTAVKLSFVASKRFTTAKPLFAMAKIGSNKRQPSGSPRRKSLRRREGPRAGPANFDF